jgi:hypothetical protein
MNGGAKRRTSKQSLKTTKTGFRMGSKSRRSSKTSKRRSSKIRKNQKGGKDGKIDVIEKGNPTNKVELTKENVAKARNYYNNIDPLVVANVDRILNLDGLINKYNQIEVEKIVVEAIKWIKKQS